jgi:hypothetical protein
MAMQRSSNKQARWLLLICLLGTVTILTACSAPATPTPCPTAECPQVICPKPVAYEDLWAESAHADQKAEAFTHWNEDDPQEIPAECAQCHSRPGFIDYLGLDDTKSGSVENAAAIGTTVTCYVCHNEAALILESVVFPSGTRIRGLGPEARCISCHRGRASTDLVDDAISEFDLISEDSPNPELEFLNSHSISGATPFGADVQGAYQYSEKTYQGRFVRGEEFFDCLRCHDQHSLELKIETCGECHTYDGTEPKEIRVDTTDFDGDGNMDEGIAFEIEAIQEILLAELESYAINVTDTQLVYAADMYPYFFIDINSDGIADADEAIFENRFNAWTARLLRAAYNYNYVLHDPGAYAHNSDYTLQILYDSLEDIGGDVTGLARP